VPALVAIRVIPIVRLEPSWVVPTERRALVTLRHHGRSWGHVGMSRIAGRGARRNAFLALITVAVVEPTALWAPPVTHSSAAAVRTCNWMGAPASATRLLAPTPPAIVAARMPTSDAALLLGRTVGLIVHAPAITAPMHRCGQAPAELSYSQTNACPIDGVTAACR